MLKIQEIKTRLGALKEFPLNLAAYINLLIYLSEFVMEAFPEDAAADRKESGVNYISTADFSKKYSFTAASSLNKYCRRKLINEPWIEHRGRSWYFDEQKMLEYIKKCPGYKNKLKFVDYFKNQSL